MWDVLSVGVFLTDVFVVCLFGFARFLVEIVMFNDNFGPAEASDDCQFIELQSDFDAIHVCNKKAPTASPLH